MRDCLADIATLAEVDLGASPDAYSEAMRPAYWEDKDLSAALAIAFAGISRLLAEAHRTDAARARELRSAAKRLTYDLASFSWPGWDEPGIIVTPPETRAGHSAARANLAMAQELDKGELPLARAYWMLGAHELASGHHADALGSFTQAAETADRAGETAEAALSRAFAALAAMTLDPARAAELDGALTRLAEVEGGTDLVTQVETARSALDL